MITLKKTYPSSNFIYIKKSNLHSLLWSLLQQSKKERREEEQLWYNAQLETHHLFAETFNIKINLFSLEKKIISHGLIFLFRFNHLAQGWRILNEKINTMNSKWRSSYLLLEITIGNYSIYLSNECYIFPGIKRTRLCKLQSKGS